MAEAVCALWLTAAMERLLTPRSRQAPSLSPSPPRSGGEGGGEGDEPGTCGSWAANQQRGVL
jgi:hypothetical protein